MKPQKVVSITNSDQLSGILKSKIKLSNKRLSQARDAFEKEWAKLNKAKIFTFDQELKKK